MPCFLISLVTGYLLEGNKYTGYHRQGLKYQIFYRSKKNTCGISNTYRTVPIPVSTWQEYFSNPFVLKSFRSTVYRVQYYTVQYPSSSTEIPIGRPYGAKSKYRCITDHQEILESYQNTYGEPCYSYTKIPTGGCQ
jgi:hypothetical protein